MNNLIKICKIDGCGKEVKSKNFCSIHYGRLWLHGDPLITKPRGRKSINKIKLNCLSCGNPFEVYPSHADKYKCCSFECGKKYRKINPNKPKPTPWNKKKWRLNRNGYIVCYHQRKEIKQHRWVMENHLGRTLLQTEYVHHKNSIKTDNRLENLEIVSSDEHAQIHWGELEFLRKENARLQNELNLLKFP